MSLFFLLNPKHQQAAWQFEVGSKVLKQIEKEEAEVITIDVPDDDFERIRFLRLIQRRKKKTADAVQMIVMGLDL